MKYTSTSLARPPFLRCDSSFKAIFAADTPESNAALKDLISTILNREVKEMALLPNEPVVEIFTESQMSFDVSVKFNDGEKVDLDDTSRLSDLGFEFQP